MPSESTEELIRRLTEEARRSGRWDWEREAAARTGGLPVYATMGGILVIRPDGTVVWMLDDSGTVEEVREEGWRLVALTHAVQKYPELKSLAPVRPAGATECKACGGRGWVLLESVVCGDCSSTGWRG